MQRAMPPGAPPGTLHELARIASQAIPQPAQFAKDGSLRPSVSCATARWMQLPPQHRCASVHSGVHIEGGIALSGRGVGPPSIPPPPHMPMKTHVPMQHSWVAAHSGSQSPARPPPAQPGRYANESAPSAREITRTELKLITTSSLNRPSE
jgi:hypothetical protein